MQRPESSTEAAAEDHGDNMTNPRKDGRERTEDGGNSSSVLSLHSSVLPDDLISHPSDLLTRVGDIVTRTGDCRPWRVVAVYPELGFARLEFAGEAWVKSATERLENLDMNHGERVDVGPR